MTTSFALSLLLLWVLQVLSQDTTSNFTITAPKAGDTVNVDKTTTAGVEVPIRWTVPDAIADRPVFITLVQGNDLSSLSRIEQINSSTPNNGSYIWRGDVFDSSLVYNYGHGAPSGCNYSIELKVWTDIIYSGYFTIINPDDGGLNSTSECPEGKTIGPTSQAYEGTSTQDASEQASTTASGEGSDTSSSSSSSPSPSNAGTGNGGVSTTTLAVAVAVPIVVLIVAFGLILWLGMRKGWFVKKSQRIAQDGAAAEKSDVSVQANGGKGTGGGDESAYLSVRELHADARPHQLGGNGLHELQGGEGGHHAARQ